MVSRRLKSVAIAMLAIGMAASANAATIFNFSFSVPWTGVPATTATGSGQLYTDLQGDGSYQVYDVVGTSKVTSGASTATLDSTSAIAGLGTPTITGNTAGGFSINAVQLSGTDTYNVTRNAFSQTYTVTNGLRTSTGGTFMLALLPDTSPVPELGTWLMMIVGFGAIGAALRSGKRQDNSLRA